MPGGERTGPMGQGPMTGRAAGYCAGNAVPGAASTPGGRGFGGGGGRGRRGRRNQFHATGLTGWQRAAAGEQAFGAGQVAPAAQTGPDTVPEVSGEQELGDLRQEAETMRQQMEQLRARIEQLETED